MRRSNAKKRNSAFHQSGVVLLMTVIMIGSLLLIMGLSMSHIGQTEIIITGQMDRGQHARTRALSCAEDALYRLKSNSGYAGGSVNVGDVVCAVAISGAGSTRTINATASSDSFNKTIIVNAELLQNAASTSSVWNITSWQETNQ